MNASNQPLWGLLAAVISILILLGSLALSMVEGGVQIAQAFTPTHTIIVDTPLPGEPTFTPSPTPPPTNTPTLPGPRSACSPPSDWIPIAVQLGDTLEGLAEIYPATVDELKTYNCLPTGGALPDGSIVYVPPVPPTPTSTLTSTATEPPQPPAPPTATTCGPPRGWVPYTVRSGDTLFSLSQEVGASVNQLQIANCLARPDRIRAGSTIYLPRLPVRQPSPTATQIIRPSDTPTSLPPTATTAPTRTMTPTSQTPPTSRPSSTPTDTPAPSETPTTTDTSPPPTPSPSPSATPVTPTISPPTETSEAAETPGLNTTLTIPTHSTTSTITP